MLHQDKLLSDYAKGFSGPRDATGLLDAGPPTWWVEQWYKLQSKDDGATNIGGNVFQFDADTGNLTIKGHMGATQIAQGDLLKVISFLMAGPPVEQDPNGIANQVPGVNTQAAAYEFSPQLKQQHDRNWDAIEKWAKASSKSYPKNT